MRNTTWRDAGMLLRVGDWKREERNEASGSLCCCISGVPRRTWSSGNRTENPMLSTWAPWEEPAVAQRRSMHRAGLSATAKQRSATRTPRLGARGNA